MILQALLLTGAKLASVTPVTFWRSGDDGLSIRFYEAIDQALAQHKRIARGSVGKPARFNLYAEQNVRPLRRGRGDFSYKISLRNGPRVDGSIIARLDGRCVGKVEVCAERVVRQVVARIKI